MSITLILSLLLSSEITSLTSLISKSYVSLYSKQIVCSINSHLRREIALSLKSSTSPLILNWLKNEADLKLKTDAFKEIDEFSNLFNDKNIFIVSNSSKNFYYLTPNHKFEDFSTQGVLSALKKEDVWYFKTAGSNEKYILNADVDRFLNKLKVWINVKVVAENRVLGVIGTGLSIDSFLQDVFNSDEASGTKSLIINNFGSIQVDSDIKNIHQNSFSSTTAREEQTIYKFFSNSSIKKEIEDYLTSRNSNIIISLNEDPYEYVSISLIKGTNWYAVTFFDSDALFKANRFLPFVQNTIIIFFILAFILAFSVQKMFVVPFEKLNKSLQDYGDKTSLHIYGTKRKDEFGVLSRTIQNMNEKLESHNEQRLSRLLKNVPVGIFMLDKKYRFCYVNPYFLKQFSCESEECLKDTLSKGYESLFVDSLEYERFITALKQNPDTLLIETQLFTVDKKPFWADVRLTKAQSENDKYTYEGILINSQTKKDYEMKLIDLATIDRLTGIYNRHYFDNIIIDEINRCLRYNEELSMIMFDLDHFKRVNDTWGHDIGDEVLKNTARIVETHIRKSDIFARWGGEEFVILMPNTNSGGAFILAEKIRLALAEYNHSLAGIVTASFGVAEYVASDSSTDWFKSADTALFEAKKSGRNKVVISKKSEENS